MKKTTIKPVAKKPAAKKPAAKKSPAKPTRKAEGQSELVGTLTRLVDGQAKIIGRLAQLTAITQELVHAVGRLGEGVELLLQASERPHTQQGEPANVPGEVVGVMVVDESENGGGEDSNDHEE